MTAADPDRGAGSDRGAGVGAQAVVVCLAALLVLPLVAQKILGGNRQSLAVIGSTAALRQVDLLQGVLGLMTVAACLFLVLRRAPSPVARTPQVLVLAAFVVPWVALSATNLVNGVAQAATSFGYLIVVVALWRAAAPLRALGVLGVLGGLVAAASVLLGVLRPELGLYANARGLSVDAGKGVFFDRLLSGVFLSTNNLGQFLVLALPFAFLLSRAWVRFACVTLTAWAILWSGSRSSMAAMAAVLLALGVVRLAGERRRAAAAVLLGTAGAACVSLPFIAQHHPTSFSGRGRIWHLTLDAWERAPWSGLGSDWFLEQAGMRTELGPRAAYTLFHAHNQLLHVLATGGAIVGLATFVMIVLVCYRAVRLRAREGAVAVAYLVAFFVSGALELNLGIVDRWQFWVTTLVPLVTIAASGPGRRSPAADAGSPPPVGAARARSVVG